MSEKKYICGDDHIGSTLGNLVDQHLLEDEFSKKLANLFKAMSDPTRLKIIGLLAHAEMCVGDICQVLDKSQPSISHHLRLMRLDNIVKMRRDGQHIIYTLADDHIHTLFHQGLSHVQE